MPLARTSFSGTECNGHVVPVNEVRANGMLPASPPKAAVKKHMVLSAEETRRARISHKPGLRQEMILRAHGVVGEFQPAWRILRSRIRRNRTYSKCASFE